MRERVAANMICDMNKAKRSVPNYNALKFRKTTQVSRIRPVPQKVMMKMRQIKAKNLPAFGYVSKAVKCILCVRV